MTRWILALCVWFGWSLADASMMRHYDLAGLISQSEAVVVADRSPTRRARTSSYIVKATLRGTLAVGTKIELDDEIYRTNGHTIDARVVVFLQRRDAVWQIVPSGLRVFEAGKAYRFEQHNNPGPYVMVPQGSDPQDTWGTDVAQLDLLGLERAIGDAAKRIDAVAAAGNEHDAMKRRAALLALFPAAAAKARRPVGFYTDRLAERARAILVAAGDLEGALRIELVDRSPHRTDTYGAMPDLVAIANDARRGDDLRVVAISLVDRNSGLYREPATVRAMIALINDPSPRVRGAAIHAAVQPASTMVSDPAGQRALQVLVAEAERALATRYAVENDLGVRSAISDAFEYQLRKPLPARTR